MWVQVTWLLIGATWLASFDKWEEPAKPTGQSSKTHLVHSVALVDQVLISHSCWGQTDTPHPEKQTIFVSIMNTYMQ